MSSARRNEGALLKVDHLTKRFSGNQPAALDSVKFQVNNGEVVGFVGLNGAGKTTTIRIAAGVALPTSGSVTLDDNDIVSSKAEASSSVGWVPEIPNFEPNAKAYSLMTYFYGFYGIPTSEAGSRSSELLKSVGLSGSEIRKIRTYSQGMKKRFSLAVSMLSNPPNYPFDEILNGLGVRWRLRTRGDSADTGELRHDPADPGPDGLHLGRRASGALPLPGDQEGLAG